MSAVTHMGAREEIAGGVPRQDAGRKGCLDSNQALAFVTGAPNALADSFVLEHLNTCDACRTLLGEAARALDSGRSDPSGERRSGRPRTLAVGELVASRYEIVSFVASGGMGEVYEARDTTLNEVVALKTLVSTALDDSVAMERLRVEVRLARQVTHRNVCRILEFGRHELKGGRGESIPFLTMEFLEGETLDRRLARQGRVPATDVARILEQILSGLGAMHAAGIMHRDIKPQNIFLLPGPPERVVLVDFGLAKSIDTGHGLLTGPVVVGTMEYMAPEQIEGAPATRSFDVYALGVVLFEMLTGRRPFSGETPLARTMERLHKSPPKPSSICPDLPPFWDEIVTRCLARDPERRFGSVDDIATRLQQGLARPGSGRRQTKRIAAALAVAAAVVTFVVAVAHRSQPYRRVSRLRGSELKPFPVHAGFPGCPSCIHPNVSQPTLDADTAAFYDAWKESLLKTWPSGDLAGEHYVRASASGGIDGWPAGVDACSQSEEQGFGMVIFAVMAGYDPDAKAIFDSMNRVRKAFPSTLDRRLMSWVLPSSGNRSVEPQDPATDGDMDMAYALLLAHDQWGDEEHNHYLADARSIISGMEDACIIRGNGRFFPRLVVGGADHMSSAPPESKPAMTRPADFMIDHLRAYYVATGHKIWADLEESSLAILLAIRDPQTGLVPDFVVDDPPVPSKTGVADEGLCYDCFDFSSSRVPLLQTVATVHLGVPGSKDIASKMVGWARTRFKDTPATMTAVFTLDGKSKRDSIDPAFTSPMVAAAVTDPSGQKWLDAGWAYMKTVKTSQFYGASLTLMSMLAVSGNWWIPRASAAE
jgi:serine/threonine protein kinase/endo-1,4-beta-D-glucanase Y